MTSRTPPTFDWSRRADPHVAWFISGALTSIVLVLIAWHTAGAQAGQTSDRPTPAPVIATRPTAQGPALPPSYLVRRFDLDAEPARPRTDGWGVVVSGGGLPPSWSSVSPRETWVYDPAAQRTDFEAGLSWRHGNVSTVVGFGRLSRDSGFAPPAGDSRKTAGRSVIGIRTRIELP